MMSSIAVEALQSICVLESMVFWLLNCLSPGGWKDEFFFFFLLNPQFNCSYLQEYHVMQHK